MHPLATEFLQRIEQQEWAADRAPLLVALSGGADSVALLHLLLAARPLLRGPLRAAHINHKLRGAESEGDVEFVRTLCRARGIPCQIRDAAVDPGAPGNLEDTARRRRYAILAELAAPEGARVVTAHTRDDQAETLLLKLFRGAGPKGLSGILSQREHRLGDAPSLRLVRPLLFAGRERILDFLAAEGLEYRVDRSNDSLEFDRNWIRHELIPAVRERLNLNLSGALLRTAELFEEIEDFLEEEAGRFLQERSRLSRGERLFEVAPFRRLHPALQKQVARRVLGEIGGGLQGMTRRHVDAVVELAQGQSGREIQLPGRVRAIREFDEIRFSKLPPVGPFSYRLKIPGELFLPELSKRVRVVEAGPAASENARLLAIGETHLVVRNRRPGDRYHFAPDGKVRRLKELFCEQRIALSERDRRVVLQSGSDILWVEGFPPNPAFEKEKRDRSTYYVEVLSETF